MRRSYSEGDLFGVWGATEQLWNAFHNCSVAPQTPITGTNTPHCRRRRTNSRLSQVGTTCLGSNSQKPRTLSDAKLFANRSALFANDAESAMIACGLL